MAKLEDLVAEVQVDGVLADGPATVVAARSFESEALELTFKDQAGKIDARLLYRDDEPVLKVRDASRPWSFDFFRLVAEHRTRLAYLFDPLFAVHTSLVQPLSHQITAVYGEMLSRQPPLPARRSFRSPKSYPEGKVHSAGYAPSLDYRPLDAVVPWIEGEGEEPIETIARNP